MCYGYRVQYGMGVPEGKKNQKPQSKILTLVIGSIFAVAVFGGVLRQMQPRYNSTATDALVEASRSQDSVAIREAIQAGADPNARFPERRTAIGVATLWLRSLSPFRPNDALFARRELASRPMSVLAQAIQSGDPTVVSALLNAGANPNQAANHGWTPLAYAANASAFMPKKSLAITRLLLASGADPNRRDSDGATPLLVALYSNAPEPIIRLLLESGADTSVRMSTGATVNSFLSSSTKPDIINLFREREKNPPQLTRSGG